MHQLCLVLRAVFEADIGAARLVVLEVGAGGNLFIAVIGWEPDLNIVGLSAGKAEVAAAEGDDCLLYTSRCV